MWKNDDEGFFSPTCQKVRLARTPSPRRADSQFALGGLRVRTARTFWGSQGA